MVKPFIPPLPSARPSSVTSTSAAAGSAAAADQPPLGKENTANVTLSSSSSFGTAKSASKVGVGSRGIPTNTSRASPAVTDAATSHSITEDLTGASASSSTAVARTPARSALGGRPPKTGGSAIRSSSSSAAAAAASSTPLAAPTLAHAPTVGHPAAFGRHARAHSGRYGRTSGTTFARSHGRASMKTTPQKRSGR